MHQHHRCRAFALLAVATLAAACREPDGTQPGAIGDSDAAATVVQDGIRLSFAIERVGGAALAPAPVPTPLQVGERARVTLSIGDAATGRGLAGLRVGAWLAPRPAAIGDRQPDAATTRDIVRKLVNSPLGSGATSLNAWFLVTLNTDGTLAVIDPAVDFSRTRLQNLVALPGPGVDFAFDSDGARLFATLGDRGEIAIVDLDAMTLRGTLTPGGRLGNIERQPLTGRLWVEDEAGSGALVIDERTATVVATVPVGPGGQLFAFAGDDLVAFVGARGAGTIVAVGPGDGPARQRPLCKLDQPLQGLAYAAAARTLFAVTSAGRLLAIAPADGATAAIADVPVGAGPLFVAPDGRWLLLLDRAGDRVLVVDTATRSLVHTIATGRAPQQITFTPAFAHVHCAGSRDLTSIQLSALADAGAGPTTHVPMLQRQPASPAATATGPLLATTPAADAVLIAAPDEQLVYLYVEGMNAPMGSYQNYGRVPVAIGVLDRSLRPLGDGVYATVVPLEQHGELDVYVYLDQPTQLFARFPVHVEPDAATVAQLARRQPAALPEAVQPAAVLPVGRAVAYRFRLLDRGTGAALVGRDDVRVIVHERNGNWQRRTAASALADGGYEVALELPQAGAYRLMVQCPSANLTYDAHRPLTFSATDDVEVPAAKEAGR